MNIAKNRTALALQKKATHVSYWKNFYEKKLTSIEGTEEREKPCWLELELPKGSPQARKRGGHLWDGKSEVGSRKKGQEYNLLTI